MASRLVEMSNENEKKTSLVPKQHSTEKSHSKLWVAIFSFVILSVYTIATVFITKAVIENNNSSSSTQKDSIPKNLIIIVSDGMGQTYNTAYRAYKNVNATLIDKHFKGRYSTTPTNKNGITDSAAGATVFSIGKQTHNSFIGLDAFGNPHGSILAAAKRQHKGTGIVVTKSVTDATPASFSAYSMDRDWEQMISKQQAMRSIDGEPMLDILFGGGRKYFEQWGFFQNKSIWNDKYGWNTVTDDGANFIQNLEEINIAQMPFMALFADETFPFYLDRINDNKTQYPTLMDMSKKAINLLNAKYEKDGFFLLVEASKVDTCGHMNDIVCAIWEMEEFMLTTEYILNWAETDGNTLVVMLSDHETGGLVMGRDASFYKDDIVDYFDGKGPRDMDVSAAWASFEYDYSIDPPLSISDTVEHYGAYKFFPELILNSRHTAEWFFNEIEDENGSINTIDELYIALETMYCNCNLTDLEKDFIASVFNRSSDGATDVKEKAIVMLMNARTLTGWTTHGHSGADCAVYAYGPMEDEFVGHRTNYEIGKVLRNVFGVEKEQQMETEFVQKLFVNGSLQICDANDKLEYVEWNDNVSYPEGNFLYDTRLCVEEWL